MQKLLIPVLTAAVLAGTPAYAGEVTIAVSSDGLDLTRAADIAAMKDRIDVAVNKACAKPGMAARFGAEAVDECVTDGTAKALAALDVQLARD